MTDKDYLELYKKLQELIGSCYEKYKDQFSETERNRCEEYLYTQGEYGEAYEEIGAILKSRMIEIDEECKKNLEEAKTLMMLK